MISLHSESDSDCSLLSFFGWLQMKSASMNDLSYNKSQPEWVQFPNKRRDQEALNSQCRSTFLMNYFSRPTERFQLPNKNRDQEALHVNLSVEVPSWWIIFQDRLRETNCPIRAEIKELEKSVSSNNGLWMYQIRVRKVTLY